MWPRKPRFAPKGGVVAAAEALLQGRVFEQHGARCHDPPPWALVNTLAHATVEKLRAIADMAVSQHPGSLDAALGRLAPDVLAVGAGRDEVVAVQRELLVPVELILLGNGYSSGITLDDLEVILRALLAGRRQPEGPCDV